jgi:hypothetical protein
MSTLSATKIVIAAVAAALLTACGGGGGGGTSTPVDYPLKTAVVNFISSSYTLPFTVSGTYQTNGTTYPVTGSGTEVQSQLSSMTFEGSSALGHSFSFNGTLTVNNTSQPLTQSTVEYFDSNYKTLGSNGSEYVVVTQANDIPTIGHVNDSGPWYVANRYTSSAKTTLLGTETITYAIAPETTSTALVTLTLTEKDTSNVITYVVANQFRITSSGVVTRIGQTATSTRPTTTLLLNVIYR